ncbi:MAG: TRAP transporter substrate-binding protein [Paracoccaceae bacterium]|nr:TRAP transporter substrate-binding protein [Paracoccaceae bacterium]MDE2912994.1 TRAP transporter substrate-binding protein [Paracoccaceae bacterium]
MTVFKSILGAAVALAISTFANAEELKLAHFASIKYHLHVEMFIPLSEKLAEATGGETTIRIYPGGELGAGPVKQYDRVIDGVADIVYALPGYTASQFKKTLLVELPGVVNPGTNKTEAIWDNIGMLESEFRRTKLLGLWTAGDAILLMAEKKIETLSDLDGLKIRVPSKNTGRLIEAWGATAVSMPITQVYQSMETGVVDGTLVDTSVLTSFKLGEVTKFITRGMNATNSVFMLIMNRDSWDGLDDDTRMKLSEMTGAGMSEGGRVTMTSASDRALAKWIEGGGEVIDLSADAAAEFNAASDTLAAAVIAELDGEGIDASGWAAALRN